MIKLFWKIATSGAQPGKTWQHDPLGHPRLRDMTLRELGDLDIPAELPLPCRDRAASDHADMRKNCLVVC